jgi:polyisoprenyl-teichoic acid--peptidoglycan teichoic acid transferase
VSAVNLSASNPVRNPDAGSVPLMTKRAWWLVGMNILVPGSAQVLAGDRRLGRFGLASTLVLWTLAVIAGVAALAFRDVLLAVATNTIALWALVLLLAFYAVLWIVLTLDTLRLARLVRTSRRARGAIALMSVGALLLTAGGFGYAAVSTTSAIGLLDRVFGGGEVAEPVDGRYNILLLGGDAGSDRVGLRPDSISVVSIEADTGRATLIGIPRNLQRAPFEEGSPLWGPFPDGYSCGDECLVSYLYTYAEEHPELYPDAEAIGSRPGIEATEEAVAGVLGIEIQYTAIIDLHGFQALIDALGGITIDVPTRTAIGANTFDDGTPADPAGYIEAGRQHMDGYTALWYARTRYATTDYERMARQRQVQEALVAQMDPATVVSRFNQVAAAGQDVVATDIPQSMLGYFIGLAAKTRELPIDSIDFVPPEWDPVYPDYDAIHARVDEALVLSTETGEPQG